MKLKIILLFSVVLFLFPIAKADFLNFTGQDAQDIDTSGLAGNLGYITTNRAFFEDPYYYHLINYNKGGGDSKCGIAKFQSENMSIRIIDYQEFDVDTGSRHACNMDDFNSTHILVVRTKQETGTDTVNRTWVKKDDLSYVDQPLDEFSGSTTSTNIQGIGISPDGLIAIINYTQSPALNMFHYNGSQLTELKLPSALRRGFNLRFFNLTIPPNVIEYWAVLQNDTNLYYIRWDSDYTFIDYERVNTANFINDAGFFYARISMFDAVIVPDDPEFLHILYKQNESSDNEDTLYFRNEMYYLVHQTGDSHGLEEKVNLTLYDSKLNVTEHTGIGHAGGIGLMWDSANGLWNILYQIVDRSAGENQAGGFSAFVRFLGEEETCNCGTWNNISGCGVIVDGHQKQIRACFPDECDTEYQYIDCDEIAPTYNRTREHECEVCETGWKKVGEENNAECSVALDIPENCTNILTNATWNLDVELLYFMPETAKKYNLYLCNPDTLEGCFEQEYSCSQYNVTQTKDSDDYIAGETAQARFGISGAGSCKQVVDYHFDRGWNRYNVRGEFCYRCDRYCGGWVCRHKAGKEWRVLENADCSLDWDNSEECEFDCEDGVCLSATEEQELEDLSGVTSIVGALFGVGLSMLDNIFPSGDLRILGGLIISFGVGIGITGMFVSKGRGRGQDMGAGVLLGLIGIIGMMFFFTIRGWFPIWMVLLVAIPSVAFIVLFMVGKKSR